MRPADERRATHGFTLLEILVAVTILAVALVTVLGLHARNIRLTARAQDLTTASMLASCIGAVTRGARFPQIGVTSGDFGDATTTAAELTEQCRNDDATRFRWRREVRPIPLPGFEALMIVNVAVGTEEEPELAELEFVVRSASG